MLNCIRTANSVFTLNSYSSAVLSAGYSALLREKLDCGRIKLRKLSQESELRDVLRKNELPDIDSIIPKRFWKKRSDFVVTYGFTIHNKTAEEIAATVMDSVSRKTKEPIIIELNPGIGLITEQLFSRGLQKLVVFDDCCLKPFKQIIKKYKTQIELHQMNAFNTDFGTLEFPLPKCFFFFKKLLGMEGNEVIIIGISPNRLVFRRLVEFILNCSFSSFKNIEWFVTIPDSIYNFPMLRPCSWRTAVRMQRLKVAKKQEEALRKLKQASLHAYKGKNYQQTLMGFIGQTFRNNEESKNQIGLDPEDYNFKFGKWCYDTPGVVHEAQILKLLTTFELSKVLPLKPIIPRNFKLKAGNTLFIAGLARLDFLEGNLPVWFTVYASSNLPITITYVQYADFIYQKLLGTDEFAVPRGNAERMEKWPELMSRDFKVYGIYKNNGGADIVLSSAGWVSISPSPSSSCKVRAWTPDGRGIFLRRSNLIRSGWRYRGNKIRGTPAYETSIKIVDDVEIKF